MDMASRLLRIGIFYDGNYFFHVSNYYCYAHQRRARISIPGLHGFIRKMVSSGENVDEKWCQIVDCHYFRGRLPALEANSRQILLNERVFDDILMREGVVTHYLPMSYRGVEKGVDVSLALETLELTLFKKFNVVVLIASDGDYLPLVRKLNALGTRVMVLGWDFEYTDDNDKPRYTCTSAKLLNEVTYPVYMHKIIDGETLVPGVNVDDLFVAPSRPYSDFGSENSYGDELPPSDDNVHGRYSNDAPKSSFAAPVTDGSMPQDVSEAPRITGEIVQLKNGYGFIAVSGQEKNTYFYWSDVINCDFNDLSIGDTVTFVSAWNDRGPCAKNIERKF